MATGNPNALARIDPQHLLTLAIEKGAIDVLERVMALTKEAREITAREAWYEAMAGFQAACGEIRKTRTAKIGTRGGGSFEYHFAPLDHIMNVIQKPLGQHGLSVSWRTPVVEADRVTVKCRISHILGHHEESGDVNMPVPGGGEGGANAMQRVGIALSYAKRYSLLNILGIAPDADDDGQHLDDTTDAPASAAADRHETPSDPAAVISEPQARRFTSLAAGGRWEDEQVRELLTAYGYSDRSQIRLAHFTELSDHLKLGYARWSAQRKGGA